MSRFKHGFFVDDFTTTQFSEIDHKAYSATVENDDVMPEREVFTLSNPLSDIHQNYIEYTVVTQQNATGSVSVLSNTVATANTWAVRKEPGRKNGDTFTIKMASVSAPVTLYGHFYSGADAIEVYQGNTLIKRSNTTFLAQLTAADKTKLKSNAVPGKWFSDVTFKDFSTTTAGGDPSVKNSFKISWTHNPASGTDYTIKVKNHSVVWRYAIEYPINISTVSNTSGNTTGSVVYTGTMKVSPDKIDTRFNNDNYGGWGRDR